MSTERRRLVQVVPDSVRELWDKWDLRILVLISFVCHIFLLAMGKSRKNRIESVKPVWALYLISDWVLNVSLGVISSKVVVDGQVGQLGENANNQVLVAFWSTLLLVHFGGPPTITAEALEDNALWLRNFVLWIFQTFRVLYIVFLAWRSEYWLSYFSVGMLVVGFIKCGERTWAQHHANIDIGHDIKSKEDNCSDGYNKCWNGDTRDLFENFSKYSEGDPRYLFENFKLFFVSLFKDFVLSSDYLQGEQSFFRSQDYKNSFKFVEVQLGYAYDVLYTKAYVMFCPLGRFLCACTASIVIAVFICFCKAKETEMHGISKTNQVITWFLVVGVLYQELYTVDAQLYTNWNRSIPRLKLPRVPYVLYDIFDQNWLAKLRKCNLLTSCLNTDSRSKHFKVFLESTDCDVDENLKENLFKHFSTKSNNSAQASGLNSIDWTKRLEFHQSILTWHIATDLCYGTIDDEQGLSSDFKSKVDISKDLSEYMLYILAKQRHMLPIGRGVITFPITCKETSEFLRQSKITSDNRREVCIGLLQFKPNSNGGKGQSNSALFDACRLASSLNNEMETLQRWELLANVWMEILGYAATKCRPEQHAQQLRRGGEFLTHVWLLMAHLGLMEQFQVNTGTPTDSEDQQPTDQTKELVQGNNDERVQKQEERIGEEEIVEEQIP